MCVKKPPGEESTRIAALHSCGVLDTAPEPAFDDLARLASRAAKAPMAFVAFVDGGRVWMKAKTGLDVQETPKEGSFCAEAIRHPDVLVVEDATLDVRFAKHPLVRGPPFVRFYAGAAVITSDGQPIGALCVLDTTPRTLEPSVAADLRALARQAAALIELRNSARDAFEAKAALEVERAQLSGVLRAATEYSIIGTEPEGTIRVFNKGAEQMLGYRADEVVGLVTPLAIHEPEEVAARAAELGIAPDFGVFVGAARRGDAETRAWTYVHKDGRRIPVVLTVTAIRDNGYGITGFIGIARDVAAERRAERERARLLAESAARAAVERTLDRLKRLHAAVVALSAAVTPAQVVNVLLEHAVAAFGATSGVVALLDDDRQTLGIVADVGRSPEVVAAFRTFPVTSPLPVAEAVRTCSPLFVEALAARETRAPGDLVGAWLDGDEALAASPLMLEAGHERRPLGGFCLTFAAPRAFRDEDRVFLLALGRQCAQALERARLFQAESIARADAERSDRAKDDFLAMLSHELRTPLTCVLGWTKMLQQRPGDAARVQRGLAIIARSAVALQRIIDDIVDISRIAAGKLDIDRAPVDVAMVVQRAVESTMSAAAAADITLDSVIEPQACAVLGDTSRLGQVVTNLLANAVKFTPRGGRVAIRLDRSGSQVRLRISDTGVGLAADLLPRAFERFWQADSSRTRAHGGLGLGLSIAKHIVELHGGTIAVESGGLGCGVTVTILLPALDPAVASATASTACAPDF